MVSLELVDLTKAWPSATVSISLVAEAGKILAVAGPSGCGKSTMLRMVAGLINPDSGRVLVGGRDVTASEPRDRGIGMVFQDYALFPHLDVAGNVAYGLRHARLGRTALAGRVARLLDTVGLSGFGRRKPHELSGGERQRVALARTLAVEPAVILFDEPLSSLDAALRKRLRSDLVDEQRRLGFTAVYVTHDLEEAMAMGDALAVMDGGRVLQCAPPRELWEAPAGVAVARFMGSGPCLPVLRFERKGGRFLARTAAGLFSLPGVDAANAGEAGNAAGIGSGGSAGQSYVFFGRSEASRVSDGAGSGESVNSFDALCLRADFAGDAVDCLMETGGERCILRFARDGAPEAGERARFGVPEARVRLIR